MSIKVMSIHLEKGGVGKTTISTQVAFELSKQGKTLIIDGDKQGQATAMFNENFNGEFSFVNYLKGLNNLDDSIYEVRENIDKSKGLFLLGTSKNSDELARWISNESKSNPFIWQKLRKEAEELGFQYILYDLPPTINDEYISWILASCDEIIPIVEPEDLSMDSYANYQKQMQKIKISFNGQFKPIDKIIINKEDLSVLIHKHWIERIKVMPGLKPEHIFEIKNSKAIPNAKGMQLLLSEYMSNNQTVKTIERLVQLIK